MREPELSSGVQHEAPPAVDRLHEAKNWHHQTQKHLFRLQESLCALAGGEDLAKDLRPTEPARRERSKERSEAVESRHNVQRAEKKATEVTSNAPGAAPETTKTGSDALKAVPEETKSLETGAHPVASSKAPPEADSHPVRKVLKWFQAVPHRVRNVPESPETTGSEGRAA